MSDDVQTTEMRYFVSDDVEHGCCHGACVRDRQDTNGFLSYGQYPSMVCECPDIATAERIAELLNQAEAV